MPETMQAEMFLCVDATGDYAVGKSEQEAREAYESEIQALNDCDGFRLVKVCLTVPLPEVVTLAGIVPAVEAPAALAVA